MQLQSTLNILAALGEISPEARKLIIQQDTKFQELEMTNVLTQRREDALRYAMGLNTDPVTPEQAEKMVHLIANKYRVAEHFCLTPEDVANIINHTRSSGK